MLDVLLITFPFFALVLCGYLAARRRMLPLEAIAGLNTFVLYFALPCLLYRFGSTTPLAQLFSPGVIAVYLLCALVMVGFVVTVSMNRRIGWNDASFGALVAAFPNTGFMGVPLLVALMGAGAAGPAILTITIDLIITSSLCIALSRLDGADKHGASIAARNALKGVAINPMPWAIFLGALTSGLGLKVPGPVMQTLGLLADAASPVALFSIGAVLARSQILASAGSQRPIPLRDYLPVAFIKLVLHPLLVLLVGVAFIYAGVPVDRFALSVIVLVAALPSASNVAMLAEKFGADSGRIALIILVSTAAAFLTFSGAVALVR
ncbi:MAG: AEC family transporter [Bdellovibrionales bacterium]|nr:AEC family transporter [Ramlibacter sp.]